MIRDLLATYTALKTLVKELLIIAIAAFLLFQFLTHQPHNTTPDPTPPRPAVTGPPAQHKAAP